MLELVPDWLGRALRPLRAGAERLTITRLGNDFPAIELSSLAFADGSRLPLRFTADGEGLSPPLLWSGLPDDTMCLALVVEDMDAPARTPLVHAVLWGISADARGLDEGAIRADGPGSEEAGDVGRNSYLREGWLPPDPPTGHGEHRYVFQLFAVGPGAVDPGPTPGRSALIEALAGNVLAAGMLVGTYSRGEAAPIGPAGAAPAPA